MVSIIESSMVGKLSPDTVKNVDELRKEILELMMQKGTWNKLHWTCECVCISLVPVSGCYA